MADHDAVRRFFPDTTRGRVFALVLVALLAAAFRFIYVLEVHDHPWYRTPLVDAADYHARAMQVMRGEGLGEGVYYKAPAYPFLLGQLYRVVGPRLEVAYLLQMLGGVVAALLTALVAARWFGSTVGLVTGVLFGFYAPLVYFENQVLIASPALAASIVAVALLALTQRASLVLLAGVVAGIALQLRPLNLALVAALLLWIVLRPEPWRVRVRHAALFLVPVLLLLAPTLRHNRLASGDLIPVSVNGGINFYIGNNPDYDDTVAIRPGLRWEELTKRFGAMDDPPQWQRNFYGAAFDYMRTQPAGWSALLFKKFVLVWNAREIDRNQDSSVMRQASRAWRVLGIPWLLLSVCGLVGVGLVWRRRGLHPLHALLLFQLGGVIAFFVTTRYRLVLLPWLAIAAAVTLVELAAAMWRREQSRIILLAGLLLLALLLALPDWLGVGGHPFGRPEFDRAQVLARRGEREAALEAYEAAVASHPRDPDVLFRYGEHLERMGRRDDAIAAYEATAQLAPQSYKPMLALGAAYLLAHDLESAWGALVEAERRGDPSGRTLYDMGLVRERQGEHEEALLLFESSVSKRDAPYEIAVRRLAVARCLIRLQRPEAAEIQFRAAEPLFRD
ncbi:MAG: tetratricopeptide repeat protein, partial [Candidatus Latescibacterota bacterium]